MGLAQRALFIFEQIAKDFMSRLIPMRLSAGEPPPDADTPACPRRLKLRKRKVADNPGFSRRRIYELERRA
jgi:hypothetical protein